MAEHANLTAAEAADHYRTTENTLKHWRYTRYGPRWIKVGKHVLYPRDEIQRFDAQLAREATAPARERVEAQLARGGDRARAG
jgi:hypothetical protein